MSEINTSEIDLIKVAENVKLSLLGTIDKVLEFFKKHFLKFAIVILLGGIVGVSYTHFKPSLYKSNMIGTSNLLNTEDVALIIYNFQTLLEQKDYQELGKIISLDSIELDQIKYLKVKNSILNNFKSEKTVDKTTKEEIVSISSKFNIEVVTKDYKLMDKLNIAVPEMIKNSNELTKLKVKILVENNESMYKKIGDELRLLDSVKLIMSPGLSANDRTIFYTTNPSSIYESILNLYGKQLAIKELLQFQQDFIVLHYFTKFKSPVNKNLMDYILSIFLSSLGIITIFYFVKLFFMHFFK